MKSQVTRALASQRAAIVSLKQIECGVYGDLIIIYPKPCSLKGDCS